MKESVVCRLQQSLGTPTLNEPLATMKKKNPSIVSSVLVCLLVSCFHFINRISLVCCCVRRKWGRRGGRRRRSPAVAVAQQPAL